VSVKLEKGVVGTLTNKPKQSVAEPAVEEGNILPNLSCKEVKSAPKR